MNLKGSLAFNRELTVSEMRKFHELFTSSNIDNSKPNGGIFPFHFTEDYTSIIWNGEEIHEVEGVIRLLIKDALPKDLYLNGLFIAEDLEFEENSFKLYVRNNKLKRINLNEDITEHKLLQCPHCQKIFKAVDFREVTETDSQEGGWS